MWIGPTAAQLAQYVALASLGVSGFAQPAVVYEGGRLIIGDGSAAIESGTFVVQNGRIIAVGRTAHEPGRQDCHACDDRCPRSHRLRKYTSWGAQNYTAENVLDHLPGWLAICFNEAGVD